MNNGLKGKLHDVLVETSDSSDDDDSDNDRTLLRRERLYYEDEVRQTSSHPGSQNGKVIH